MKILKGLKNNRFVVKKKCLPRCGQRNQRRFLPLKQVSKEDMAYFQIANGEIEVANRKFRLPRARGARIGLGFAFIVGGVLGFLRCSDSGWCRSAS